MFRQRKHAKAPKPAGGGRRLLLVRGDLSGEGSSGKIFSTVSDDYPKYEFTPDVFHITTQYKPDPKHEELYGKPVTICIIGYASGSVRDSEEDITSENEGLLVEFSSTDEEMQALIDSCDKVWHITGSYSVAAKYTGQLDFSDYTPVDITIEGVFGLADSNGKVIQEER